MKAPIVSHLKAVEALIQTSGLPINLKYVIEGEEEIGSTHLKDFLIAKQNELTCDFCLNVDTSILDAETPSMHYATRGIAYFELRIKGAAQDLHSGLFGGVVDNPAQVLAHLIAGMRDLKGQITLPGFYDDVRELTKEERSELAKLLHGESWWKEATGVSELGGEENYTPTERATARPTLDVNGLLSGFTGEGSKTVLPAAAMAKISTRLVPEQTPERVHRILRSYLEANVPSTVDWELRELHSAKPAYINRNSPAVQAARRALEAVWGKPPLFTREGGTIPVISILHDILSVDIIQI
jgi:acetylornithine deacetylase/succinyl-diaminopimelate desuccinylase-like protein